MSTLLDILILASILVLAVLAVRSLKKSGRRCSSGCSGCAHGRKMREGYKGGRKA